MNNAKNIARIYAVIDRSLFMTTGKLDYDRITDATILLANMVADTDMSDDGYEIWDIGEYGECSLSDFIVGAYWHYTHWHAGQWSKSYQALCALGRVFDPGMTTIESEKCDKSPSVSAYDALEGMAA